MTNNQGVLVKEHAQINERFFAGLKYVHPSFNKKHETKNT